MGNVIYSFLVDKESITVAISSYDRNWILLEAQRIADNFDVDVQVNVSLPDCKKPIAKMCISPRKAGMK